MLATETTNPLLIVVLIAFGAFVWWNGFKTWRGEESAGLFRTQTRQDVTPGRVISRRWYQSYGGLGHIGLLVGPAFVLVAGMDGVRAAVGESREWWVYELVAGFGGVLLFVAFIYAAAYLFTGVPDRLRPPCQRGWEIVDGDLRLVRPEAFHEHPKHPSAQGGDRPAGYDPWR
jgi:hypothetical protein